MGTASSAMTSAKPHGRAMSMSSASSHMTRPHLPLEQAEGCSSGLPTASKSQVENDDTIQESQSVNDVFGATNQRKGSSNEYLMNTSTSFDKEEKNCSVVAAQLIVSQMLDDETADCKNDMHEQISSVEIERALKELDLSDHEMQAALKFLNEYPKLAEHFKITTDCILSFKSSSFNTCMISLKKLQQTYFYLDQGKKTIVGDFMSCLNFSKKSYVRYVSLLRADDTEHFSDSLFNNEKTSFEVLNILYSIRSLWWNFSDSSTVFAAQLASDVGIIQELIQNILTLTGVDGKKLKGSFPFLSAIGTLHNVTKLSNTRQMFREMKLVDILANFLDYKDQPKVTMLVLMVLALIIDENQTHLLISHDSVFDFILRLTRQAWQSPDHRCDGFSVEELIQAMAGLSRNDKVKKVLVQKGVLALVLNILTEGNEKEKEESVKFLWELSFDPENKIKIQQDQALMQAVTSLSKHANRKIAKSSQGVLWVIGMEKNKRVSETKMKKLAALKKKTGSTGHVMISYNWSDQKKLKEIYEVLQNRGYKVWMDIVSIHGSTLQAMAEAVEQADVVLICMSEKYKESHNCRSEAEYAFSRKKPIIPLIMQYEYEPDGWLGILLGAKVFFNFSGKYQFEKKIDDLVKEIGDRGKLNNVITEDTPDGPIVKELVIPVGKSPDLRPSSHFHVPDWIQENDLSKFVNLQSLSTENLHFLKKLSLRAPEFYYSFMLDFISGKMSSEDLTGLMMVTSALESIPK